MARTRAQERARLRTDLIERTTFETVAGMVAEALNRRRVSGRVTLADVQEVIDRELARFYGDPPTQAAG